jgi:uncharacterized lipoprotein NlpE involved in copper resistance
MIKKALFIALTGFILLGCNNEKQQEKALLDQVIKVHDKVMAADEVVMKDKNQLIVLSKTDTTAVAKDSIAHYVNLLAVADDTMMNWMNNFNPDFTGKSHTEIMNYLGKQQQQVTKIDTKLDSIVSVSNQYLLKIKAK